MDHRLHHPSAKRPRAFTLIELLIVISIIALLVMLLMPNLNHARALARDIVCKGNQRTIVNALISYEREHGMFPYNYAKGYNPYGSGKNQRWALSVLSPALGGPPPEELHDPNITIDEDQIPDAYVCPSADLDRVYGGANVNTKYHACYWTSPVIRGNRGWGYLCRRYIPSEDGGIHNKPGDDYSSGGGGINGRADLIGNFCEGTGTWFRWRSTYRPTMDSIPLPTQTVFSGDTNNTSVSEVIGLDGATVSLPGYARSLPGQWFYRRGRIHSGMGFDRHRDKVIMSYLDGGVRSVSLRYLQKNFSSWNRPKKAEVSGDFMIRFPDGMTCRGSQMHPLPAPQVE